MSEYTYNDKQEDKDQLVEWLENTNHITSVSEHTTAVDFYIGSVHDYNTHSAGLGRSSIAIPAIVTDNDCIVDEVALHLPPANESQKEAIENSLTDLPGIALWVDGSRRGFGFSKVDGVVLPHIFIPDDDRVSVDTVIEIVESILDCYHSVYDSGENLYNEENE